MATSRSRLACSSSASRRPRLSRSNGEALITATICAPACGGGMQRLGEPQVLADQHAQLHALELEHAVAAVRVDHEVAALVEHRVVGQLALAVGALDAPVAQDAGGVVDHRARALRPADHGGDATGRGRGDPCHRLLAVVQEARAQQQVLGRIARQRQLREQHQVRAVLVTRLGDHLHDPVGVVVDRPDREVELGHGDAQGFGHVVARSSSLPRLRGRAGVGATGAERRPDGLDNPGGVAQHVMVPESQYTIPRRNEELVTPSIRSTVQVLPAIDLDHEPSLHAQEVDHVRADRHLAAEAMAIELAHAQVAPEPALGEGHVGT
jgi:hypothetical protein